MDNLSFRMRKSSSDRNILSTEIENNPYHIPKNIKVMIDIGAHIGGTSITFGALGVTVYAYEPCADNYRLLSDNVGQNNLIGKVFPIKKAVGFPTGMRTLGLCKTNMGNPSFFSGLNNTEQVEVITLDQVFEENKIDVCDVLKIDCEGAEYEFLNNCDEKLFEKINQISMELHYSMPGHENKELIEKFGVNYVSDLENKLSKYYRIQTIKADADSCKFLICTK